MKLTNEALALFAGGQIEIRDPHSKHVSRGQIKAVIINEIDELHVTFDWMGQAPLPAPKGTVYSFVQVPLDWRRNIDLFTAFDIGKDGIRLLSGLGKESVFLFPPNYEHGLDPSAFRGMSSVAIPLAATA